MIGLKQEGRLNDDDGSDKYGTNVIPLGMSPKALRDGFVQVTQTCYSADAYFQRLDAQFIDENFKFALHHLPYWTSHRWAWVKRSFLNYCRFVVLASRLLRFVADSALRLRYRQQLYRMLRARWREPHILFIYALKVATHYHYAAIARALMQAPGSGDVLPNAGRSFSRVKRRREVQAAA